MSMPAQHTRRAPQKQRQTLLIDQDDAKYWLAAGSILGAEESGAKGVNETRVRQQQHRLPRHDGRGVGACTPGSQQNHAQSVGLGLELGSTTTSSSRTPSRSTETPSQSSAASSSTSSPSRKDAYARKSGITDFDAHVGALRKLYPSSPVHVSPRGKRPMRPPPVTPPPSARAQSQLSSAQFSSRASDISSAATSSASTQRSPGRFAASMEKGAVTGDVFGSMSAPRPAPAVPGSTSAARPEHRRAMYEGSALPASRALQEQSGTLSEASQGPRSDRSPPRLRRPTQTSLSAANVGGNSKDMDTSPNPSVHPGSSLLHATPRFDTGDTMFPTSLSPARGSPAASASVYTQDSPAFHENMVSSFPNPPRRPMHAKDGKSNAATGLGAPANITSDANIPKRSLQKPLPPRPPPSEPLPRAPKSAVQPPMTKAAIPASTPFHSREQLQQWSKETDEAGKLPAAPLESRESRHASTCPNSSSTLASALPCICEDEPLRITQDSLSRQDFTNSEPDLLSQLAREIQSAQADRPSRFVERLSQDGRYGSMLLRDDGCVGPATFGKGSNDGEHVAGKRAQTPDPVGSIGAQSWQASRHVTPSKPRLPNATGILVSPEKAPLELEAVKEAVTESEESSAESPSAGGKAHITFAKLPRPLHSSSITQQEHNGVLSGPLRWLPNVRSNFYASPFKGGGRRLLSPKEAKFAAEDSLATTPTKAGVTHSDRRAQGHQRNLSSKSSTASSTHGSTFTHKSNLSASTAASSIDVSQVHASLQTQSLKGNSPDRQSIELSSNDDAYRKVHANGPSVMSVIPEASPQLMKPSSAAPSLASRVASPAPSVPSQASQAPPAPPRRSSVFASLDAAKIHDRAARRMQAVMDKEREESASRLSKRGDDVPAQAESGVGKTRHGRDHKDEAEEQDAVGALRSGMTTLPSLAFSDLSDGDRRWSSLISNGDDVSSTQHHTGNVTEDTNAQREKRFESARPDVPDENFHYGIAF